MCLELVERRDSPSATNQYNRQHECADCLHKERVYVTAPNGKQMAALWRCRTLSQKTQSEVLVQPHENCFEHRSLSDHWEQSRHKLVR